jgi:hypothetical protein
MLKYFLLVSPSETPFYKVGNHVGFYLDVFFGVLFLLSIIFCMRYIGQDSPKEEEE